MPLSLWLGELLDDSEVVCRIYLSATPVSCACCVCQEESMADLTPVEVVERLDRFIVGQVRLLPIFLQRLRHAFVHQRHSEPYLPLAFRP